MMQQRSHVLQLRLDAAKKLNVKKKKKKKVKEWLKAVLDAKIRPKEMRPYKCPLDQGFGSSISQRWS